MSEDSRPDLLLTVWLVMLVLVGVVCFNIGGTHQLLKDECDMSVNFNPLGLNNGNVIKYCQPGEVATIVAYMYRLVHPLS